MTASSGTVPAQDKEEGVNNEDNDCPSPQIKFKFNLKIKIKSEIKN